MPHFDVNERPIRHRDVPRIFQIWKIRAITFGARIRREDFNENGTFSFLFEYSHVTKPREMSPVG